MRTIVMMGLLLGVGRVLADDSFAGVFADWQQGNTNAYRAVYERRLASDPDDIAGLMMKYFWDRVFAQTPSEIVAMTNSMERLCRALEAYRGPRTCLQRDFLVRALRTNAEAHGRNDDTEDARAAYAQTIANWECWQYMTFYRKNFEALEADGAFRTPATVWTDDPTCYRVAEAATNGFACVTNLWWEGGLANVSRIADQRLSENRRDLIGRLLRIDCQFVRGEFSAINRELPKLIASLSSVTNQAVKLRYLEAKENLDEMLQASKKLARQPQLFPRMDFLPEGSRYPHTGLLKALWENRP